MKYIHSHKIATLTIQEQAIKIKSLNLYALSKVQKLSANMSALIYALTPITSTN